MTMSMTIPNTMSMSVLN